MPASKQAKENRHMKEIKVKNIGVDASLAARVKAYTAKQGESIKAWVEKVIKAAIAEGK